jgi:hypothetical protein
MVKKEVKQTGLRKLSAINFRNQSILDHLSLNKSEKDVVAYYGLSSVFSLHRYRKFMIDQMKEGKK